MTHSLDPMLFFFQTKIQIQLTEIMNPRSEATTSVFKLSSKTNDSYTIQTSTFNATMKMASDIQNVILIRDNIYLNNATNLTLEFVTLTDLYPTDYFELQISKDQVTTNYPKLIRVQTSDKRNLSIKTIDNDTNFIYLTFSDSYCLPCSSNSTLSYILTGFFNIGTTRLAIISNIIFVKDQNSFLIQEKKFGFFIKPNLASGNLSITNLKLSSLTTGTDTNLSLAFKPQSSVSNGILFVTFPTEFFFVKNYLNKNCTVQNNLYDFYNCSLNLITGSYYGEFISSLMIYNISCDPLSLFQITIIDTLRNKPTNQPNNDNIFFMTLDSNKNIIDLSVKKANDYIPVQLNQFKDLLFVRSNNFVSSHTNLSVEFRILNRIAVNANIIIHLPKKQILTNSNTSCYSNNVLESNNPILCNISSNSDYSIIKFQEFCMQNNKVYGYCPENTLFQLNLVNLINNLAVKIDSYSIQIEIVTSDSLYSYERELNGFFEMSLQMTKFQNFTIELNETNVAKSVLVTFSFVLPSPISQNGTILFNFPGDLFDYTNNQCNFYLLGTLNTIKTCNLITQINKDFNNLQIIGLNLTDSCTNTVNCLSNQEISLNFTAINIMHQSEKFSQIILKSFTSQNENISILQYNISEINFTEYNIDKDIFILRDNATLNQKSNLKMEFITPGRVIYNATMKFSLPKNQILLNINTLKIVILSPINQTLKNDQFIITNDANYYFLILNQSFCPNFCNESTNISIILVGISNPSNVKYLKYNAFFLQIFYLNETQFIFSALNGVYANPELILPSLVDVLIKRSNGVLNETIILLINFNVPKDNGRNLINNSLLIDFPDNLFYGNFPNFSIFYNGISLKNLDNQTMINKTMDNYSNLYIKTVQIDNFCNNICETGQNLTLQIQKLQNPALYFSNINNLNLNLYILSNNSLIMNKIKYNSVNIQPNIELLDIIQHSFSRNTSSPKSSVDVILDFELTSYIIPESIIQIIIPQTQIILSTQIFCLNSINNINFRCNLSSNSNITHYILTFQEFCTANSINCSNIPRRISITIKNCINPLKTPLKTNRNSITISVFSNFFNLYQQTQNNIFLYPDIYQFYLNYIKITRSSHIAGSVATYSFQITLPQTTSNDVVFLISFPEFLAYSSQNLNCDQKYMCNIITSEAFNYITQITMKNICQSTNNCLTNNLISLNFDLINQGNTYDYQINRIFSVIIESNDQIIEIARGDIRASILPAIKPGIFYFISLNSSSFKVNENMSWNLSFFISNNFQNIQNSGSININLPNEINVSTISSCEVQIFNYSNINCKVQFLNKLITLSHSSGGNENLEGRQILVIINKLLSPMSLKPTSSLIFSSFGKINGSIVKFDEMTNGTIFQAIYPGNMSMAFIERSSNILNTEISLKLNFTTSTKNNDNGMVLINVLNSDEVEFSSSNTLKCVDYLTNIPFNCSRYNNFVLISNLSNYVSNTSWTITITGLKNLYYISEVLNKYFFTIESRTSDNYLIDSTSNIHAMPKLKSGSLYISNIIRNNNEITDEISLTINLNITNQIYQNNSFLKITFPEEFLLSSLVYSLKCQINEITLSCSNVLYYDNYFVSYMSISDLKQLHTNSNLKILINFGMKNTFYVNPVNLPIIFQTYLIISDRQISGLLDQTSINSNDFLKTLSPKLILTPAISCINCAINEITDLVFRFDITHILLRNIWVKIKIPSNISFADFLENENKCVGLIGFNNNLSCFSQKNELWLHNDFNTLVMPGFFSFLIKKTKNPIVSGNYSGFNISLYYNQTYLMDYTNQGNYFFKKTNLFLLNN